VYGFTLRVGLIHDSRLCTSCDSDRFVTVDGEDTNDECEEDQ
jgi:hypothetical protein